jgi:hypothetical protein
MPRRNKDALEVRRIPSRSKITTRATQRVITAAKPPRVVNASMRTKVAAFSGCGGGGGMGSGFNTTMGSGGNFYSPELSTDFLELPQSLDEQRNYYRFFYRRDPFVAQAIDLHDDLPLSKVRIDTPEAQSRELAEQATKFCTAWAEEIDLHHLLIMIVHEYHLLGEVFLFCEDDNPEPPEDLFFEEVRVVDDEGHYLEKRLREDNQEELVAWMDKNYKGWTDIRILPPENIHMEAFPFTDERLFELVPDSKTRDVVEKARQGDHEALRIAESMPEEVIEAVVAGTNLPFNTDPQAGSFLYYLARKKSQYEPRGHSLLERCLATLVYRDKLRQAQTSIASRHMTPYRLVYAEDMSMEQTEELRLQVDQALQDPDYTIVTNFPVEWDERGADGRLLELSGEYDITDRQLYAGLGVTEGLLSGDSMYSGDRISLDVINTRYQLLRELLQNLVERHIFKPMCWRMGFMETDEYGNEKVVYPRLSFTRLPLRDNQDTFDLLFNLYQKGSLDVDVILEMLNIDPVRTRQKLERDFGTFNDSSFNEVLRSLYSEVARTLAERSNFADILAERLGLKLKPEEEEGGGRW